MALSSRELYLVLRAKNEATSTLNSLAKDFDKARASAELMGLQAQKAQLAAEQSAQRAAKAAEEYALRQAQATKATEQQTLAQMKAQQTIQAYSNSVAQSNKSADQHRISLLQNQQALDANELALNRNVQGQNQLQMAQLRAVEGAGPQIAALRTQNQQLEQMALSTRADMAARQDQINGIRQEVSAHNEQILAGQRLQQQYQGQIIAQEQIVRSSDDEINRRRETISGMREEIAQRQTHIDGVNREIAATKQANAERAQTSQRMRDTGQAMMGAGTAIAVGGGIALKSMWDLTQSAVDYQRQTAYTMTQTKGLGTSMKELGDIGLQVAKSYGVPFDEIQKSLFDIFSSMDVSVPQAKTLLNDFARAAVAGQTDVQKAGAATIGIMNAYHVPVSQATHVLDEQFQTVKLGRIEYDQLAGTIGRTIPSAQRAGQSYAVLGGMIALMTRNGATAANAVTAAGRAMDLFAKPAVGENLKKIGVATTDATGKFLPLTKVIPQLQKALEDLNPSERAAKLDALFKGSGNNIQARRFVDLVVNSKAASSAFVDFSNQIEHSSGATNTAYNTMADTMAVKSEKIKNQWQVLKIELGTSLFPILAQLMGYLRQVIDWFEGLSASQKKWMAWGTVAAGALAVVMGIVVALAGAFLVLAAAVTAATWPVILIVAAVALVVAGLVLLYTKVGWFHDGVNAFFQGVATVAKTLWDLLVATWNGIVACIKGSWEDIKSIWDALTTATHNVGQFFTDLYNNYVKPAMDWIGQAAMWLWHNAIEPAWEGIKQAISTAWGIIQGIWDGIKAAINILGQAFAALYNTWVKPYWDFIKEEIDIVWAAIQVIWGLIQIEIKLLGAAFTWLYENAIKPAWDHIKEAIGAAWDWIKANVFTPIMDFIHGPLATAWNWFVDLVNGVWNKIKELLKAGWDWIDSNVFQPIMNFIRGPLTDVWNTLASNISRIWQNVKDTLSSGWNWIKTNVFDPISNAVTVTIPNAFHSAVNAISSAWKAVQDVVMAPVRFVINTVLDDHLLAGYNSLAKTFHVQPDNVQIARLAAGGPVWGPGGPKADLVPAMLSNGEHVWTAAEVQAAGGQAAVAHLRQLALNRNIDKFAAGGPVVGKLAGVGSDVTMMKGQTGGLTDWLGDAASMLLDPIGALGRIANGIFDSIPDAGGMKDVAVGAGKTIIDGIVNFAKGLLVPAVPDSGGLLAGPQGNSVARILQWGRMFYPGAMVSSGYRPGANDYHGMGLAADLIGGGYAGMNQIAAGFYGIGGRLLELIHNDGGAGYAIKNGARVNGASYYASVWADHANHVHVAATNEALADVGGFLEPGRNLIHNNTGGRERILSLAQSRSFDQLVSLLDSRSPESLAPSGGYSKRGGGTVVVNVYTNELDPRRHAAMLGAEIQNQIG